MANPSPLRQLVCHPHQNYVHTLCMHAILGVTGTVSVVAATARVQVTDVTHIIILSCLEEVPWRQLK